MPYIPRADRFPLEPYENGEPSRPNTPGELAFTLTRVIDDYVQESSLEANYAAYALVLGVLETVKLEYYRRRVAPYEDKKLADNGDVFS